jgi:hypothetical protein
LAKISAVAMRKPWMPPASTLQAGIIDEHSHIAASGSVNEAAQASSAEVRIADIIDCDDIDIYRQLGGGVTTSHILHGSANPIGGQTQLIKLRWGSATGEIESGRMAGLHQIRPR